MTNEQINLLLTNYGPLVLSILTTLSMVISFLRKMKKIISRYENNTEMKDIKTKTLALSAYCTKLSNENIELRNKIDELIKINKEAQSKFTTEKDELMKQMREVIKSNRR